MQIKSIGIDLGKPPFTSSCWEPVPVVIRE